MGCVDGYRIIIYIYCKNGTYHREDRLVYEKCPVDVGPIIAIIALILIFIAAFVLSTLIVIAISTSFTLRKALVNRFFIALCAIVMVDSLLNMLMSVCYVAVKQWKFGYTACLFNSYIMNTLSIQMALGILILVVDRTLVALKAGTYMSLSKSKTKITLTILLSWVLSLGFSAIPHCLGIDSTLPYRKRYSCSVANYLDEYLLLPQSVILIVVITLILVVCVIVTLYKFHREQKRHRKVRGNQTLTYFDQILMTPYYRNEAYSTACVSILTLGYLLLWYPFTCVITLTPLNTSHWNNETTRAIMPEEKPLIQFEAKITQCQQIKTRINGPNYDAEALNKTSTNSSTYLIPEMTNTPDYELVFVWFRYIYDLFVPLIILFILKDVRAKCKALIFACRPNTVDSASPRRMSPPSQNSFHSLMSKEKQPKHDNIVNFKTPILFATSEGLHIRTIEETYQEMQESRPLISFGKSSTIEPQFNYELCDVTLGNEDAADFAECLGPEEDQDFAKNPLNIEKSYSNPVIEKAHRVAAGQNINDITSYFLSSANSHGKRPPTPPKPKYTEPADNSAAEEMVPIDLEQRPRKSNKIVRFNTDLNEEILQGTLSEADSALELSNGSKVSNGSGHLADIEEVTLSSPGHGERKPTFSKSKKRPTYGVPKKVPGKNVPTKNGRPPNIRISSKDSPPKLRKQRPIKKYGLSHKGNNQPEMMIKSRYIGNKEDNE